MEPTSPAFHKNKGGDLGGEGSHWEGERENNSSKKKSQSSAPQSVEKPKGGRWGEGIFRARAQLSAARGVGGQEKLRAVEVTRWDSRRSPRGSASGSSSKPHAPT